MKFPQFIGGSYESQSWNADQERTVNWFPELLQSTGATSRAVLYPTPGVEVVGETNTGNGRAHLSIGGREFAVVGPRLYEVSRDGTMRTLGTVALGNDPATISSSGDGGSQLFVTSGGNGYIWDLTLEELTLIPALSGRATMGDYLDGRFMALDGNTSTLYVSELFDGFTWTNRAQRSLAPDPWKSVKVVGRYIWLFGEWTTEVWQDTGAANFPFAPFPSVLITYGIAASFSAAVLGNDVAWLGRTQSGQTCVLRAAGLEVKVISHYPLETALQEYQSVSSAVAFSYSDRGHTFYVLSFDLDNATWAWDLETQVWAERGTWIAELDRYTSWRPRWYAFAFGQHRMLDSASGKIFRVSTDLLLDVDGRKIRRLRRAPAINDENQEVFYTSFELEVDTGLGRGSFAFFSMAAVTMTVTWAVVESEGGIAPDSWEYAFTPTITGGTGPFIYSWNMGDGETPQTNELPTYTWARNGWPHPATILVTLTVTDSLGAVATYAANVTVNFNV